MEILMQILGPNGYRATELTRGASTRRYYRVTGKVCEQYGMASMIVSHFTGYAGAGFQPFISIQRVFREAGIRVPEILKVHDQEQVLILEDVGDQSLETSTGTMDAYAKQHAYIQVVRDLASIHAIDLSEDPVFQLPFDRGDQDLPVHKIYRYDLEHHFEKLLLSEFLDISPLPHTMLNDFYTVLCRELEAGISTVMYRDFQSSNIIFIPGEDRFCYIDFQDARRGIPHYDIGALLWDNYVQLESGLREQLISCYVEERNLERHSFLKPLYYAVIQRKLHDAGAFAMAFRNSGKRHFLDYIKPAVADALALSGTFPEFADVTAFLDGLVQEAAS